MGFLPNGDLILVSSSSNYGFEYCKIYCYSFENKPTNTTFWKCSQIHELESTESLSVYEIKCFVHQTKLFFISQDRQLMFQWNLLTMTFDKQYYFGRSNYFSQPTEVLINKNQTLLALITFRKFCVLSMETGMYISSYG